MVDLKVIIEHLKREGKQNDIELKKQIQLKEERLDELQREINELRQQIEE